MEERGKERRGDQLYDRSWEGEANVLWRRGQEREGISRKSDVIMLCQELEGQAKHQQKD